jgi:hypothetical protein
MGRYLEIAKRALELTEQNHEVVLSDPTPLQLPVEDPYADRMRAVLCHLNPPDCGTRMVPWLGTARLDLYAELTTNLPDEIRQLWSDRAPLEQFEEALVRLVALYRRCCELYRIAIAESADENRR